MCGSQTRNYSFYEAYLQHVGHTISFYSCVALVRSAVKYWVRYDDIQTNSALSKKFNWSRKSKFAKASGITIVSSYSKNALALVFIFSEWIYWKRFQFIVKPIYTLKLKRTIFFLLITNIYTSCLIILRNLKYE